MKKIAKITCLSGGYFAALLAAPSMGLASEGDARLEAYSPRHVDPPKSGPYVLADGSIYIAGNDLFQPLLEKINEEFSKAHPGFKFKMDLLNSALCVPGLLAGKTAFGPLGRDVTQEEIDGATSLFGRPMTDILIGWDNNPDVDLFPPEGKYPPGIWVNAGNALPYIKVSDVKSIFTTGSAGGDITYWRTLTTEDASDLGKHQIHVYVEDTRVNGNQIMVTTRIRWFEGLPWSSRVEFLPDAGEVLTAVANDKFGIGFVGWWPGDHGWQREADLGPKVKFMPLETERGVSHGKRGEIHPFTGGLRLLINREPGKPLDPWLKEYLRFVLSREGQQIIASMTMDEGFIPIDPADVPAQLAKFE